MTEINQSRWLEWAREIQALSQTGLAYSDDDAVGFFSPDDLPPLSSARTNERHLAEVFAHY